MARSARHPTRETSLRERIQCRLRLDHIFNWGNTAAEADVVVRVRRRVVQVQGEHACIGAIVPVPAAEERRRRAATRPAT